MTAPLMGSVARMVVATTGGWLAVETWGFGLDGLFIAIAAGVAAYGLLIAGPLLIAPWRSRP